MEKIKEGLSDLEKVIGMLDFLCLSGGKHVRKAAKKIREGIEEHERS